VTDFLLGVIAVSVFVMAAIQVALIIGVVMAARRGGAMVRRLEADVKPIVANLQAMSADAAKATSLASGQVERADQLITTLSKRVEDTVVSFQSTVLQPARDALSIVGALRAAMSAFRSGGPRSDDAPAREARDTGRPEGGARRPAREAARPDGDPTPTGDPKVAGDDDDTLFVG
jgi:hypothetical protein